MQNHTTIPDRARGSYNTEQDRCVEWRSVEAIMMRIAIKAWYQRLDNPRRPLVHNARCTELVHEGLRWTSYT